MVMEAILSLIVDAVISHVVDKESDQISDKVRDILGHDPAKRALKSALKEAFANLEKRYPEWTASYFDPSFFAHEGAPILSQFLVMNGRPDASELAKCWADSLNIHDPKKRTHYISDLEPISAEFLHDLAQRLKKQEALRELNKSRDLDQIAENMQMLLQHFGADKATFGTRHDYLRWLIDQTLYLDAAGTFQTQRQVHLRLDTIYISLQARSNETLSPADDRHALFEEELASLEMEIGSSRLTAEEREDKHDLLQKRLEDRLSKSKAGKVLELAQVVNRHDRVVILGDPGSGKTTLLRYLALQHATALRDGREKIDEKIGQARFPLLLRIAEYAENGRWRQQSLSDFLPSYYTRRECPKRGLVDLLESELEKGECLVLLDGLDEIVNADERFGVVRQIDDFVRRHSHRNNRFVITSRIAGYSRAPLNEPFKHYTVCEMDEKQIRRFLEHWCKAVEDKEEPEISAQARQQAAQREIDGIMQAIKNPGVRRLAVNPLLLRLLALIHHAGKQIPQKRIELYTIAADALARKWRHAQGVAESKLYEESVLLKEESLTPLLGELAYWLHVHKPTGIATIHEVYDVLGEAYARGNDLHWDADNPSLHIQAEIGKFLSAVNEHTGLFVERAPKRYGFLHLTFEEYYVARHLVNSSRKRARLIRSHLHQPRWEEPILLAIGFVGLHFPEEAKELVEGAILAQGEVAEEHGFTASTYEDLLGRDYLFSLRCLSDNIPVRRGLMLHLMKRFAAEYCEKTGLARFSRYRHALSEMLTRLVGSESMGVLISHLSRLLRDSQIAIPVRSVAAETLGEPKSFTPEVIEALLFFLRDRQVEVKVRNKAIGDFAGLGTPGTISRPVSLELIMPLLAVLQESQIEPEVRSEATRALESSSSRLSPQQIEVLVAVLQNDQEAPQVRSAVVKVLKPLSRSSPQVTEALVAILQDGQIDHQVRSEVRSTLVTSGLSSPGGVEAWQRFLRDGQVEVEIRGKTVWILEPFSLEYRKVMASIFRNKQQFEVRMRTHSMSMFMELRETPPEIIEAALAVLRDEQDELEIRKLAARVLEQVREIPVRRDKQDELEVWKQAARMLPEITETALAVLRNQKDHAQVRSGAAEALGVLSISSPEVVKAMLVIVQDNRDVPLVRSSAIEALAQLEDISSEPEVVKTLVMVLRNDQDVPQVRSGAAEALGVLSISSPEVVDAWLFFLQDRQIEAQVRGQAILAWKMLHRSSAGLVEFLLSILRDKQIETEVRSQAIVALHQLKSISPEVIEALLSVLQDKQSETLMRNEAITALGELNISSPEVVKALLVLLQDRQSEPQTRSKVAEALANFRKPSLEVIQALLVLVRDDQDELLVRRNAIVALQVLHCSSPEVVEALLMILQDSQSALRMRSEAAEALEELGQGKSMRSPESSAALCEIFQREDRKSRKSWGARQAIASLLGQLEPTNELILSTLWQGLLDGPFAVRSACINALAQIGEQQRAFQPLIEKRFLEAIADPKFEAPDDHFERSVSDHAYRGLWQLVVGSDQEE